MKTIVINGDFSIAESVLHQNYITEVRRRYLKNQLILEFAHELDYELAYRLFRIYLRDFY